MMGLPGFRRWVGLATFALRTGNIPLALAMLQAAAFSVFLGLLASRGVHIEIVV